MTTLATFAGDGMRRFRNDRLFMNAVYLMLSTLVVAGSGFVFWALVAHAYDAPAVGLATTLISVSSLLSLLSLAGFDTTFVRFLPQSERKDDYINSGFVIVAVISAALAAVVAAGLPRLSPNLAVLSGAGAFLSFGFFTVATSLNVLTNAVFLAFRQARYIFVINALFSGFKMVLPLLAPHGDAMTIFALAGGAQLMGLVLSVAWMRRRFAYRFSPLVDVGALRMVRRFSFSVYVSSVLNLLPPTLLPLLVVHELGPANAAYYYMAFTIAGVLYTIAYASMQSVFAEGSHDEAAIGAHVAKATKLIGALLVPAMALTVVLSGVLLTVFGREYARGASALLQVFALSAVPVAGYSAMGVIFKVTRNLRGVVGMNLVYVVVILSLSYVLIPHWGVIAIGWAWMLGNVAACGVGVLFLTRANYNQQEARHGKTARARWRR